MKLTSEFMLMCILFMTTVLGACNSSGVKTLQVKDNGSTIALKPGEKFDIALEGNPTTGYTWEVAEVDSAVVTTLGEADYKAASSAIGSGGTMTFHFQAGRSGETKLKLVYHRPWEKDVPPAETFEITVTVK